MLRKADITMSNIPDIKYLARLARLELTEDEERRLQRELCEFVELASALDGFCESEEIDCDVCCDGRLREDIAIDRTDGLLALAPSVSEGYVTVPLTVKEAAR